MEYIQEFFKIWVVFSNLSGHGDRVRVRWWCIVYICLGFLIFLVEDDFWG